MDTDIKFSEDLDQKRILQYAKAKFPKEYNLPLEVVLTNAFKDLRNLPSLGYTKKKGYTVVPLQDYVEKLAAKYISGYNNRPSARKGKASKTFADPVIGLILETRIKGLPKEDLPKVVSGHSLQMTIENLVGDLLEEYLANKLGERGWYCCWGSSIDAVDFCHTDGRLLQVKNSDNSENSSSSRVRNGTTILKWSRRKSTKENTFFWNELLTLTGATNIGEEDFRKFITEVIDNNPACIEVKNEEQYSR